MITNGKYLIRYIR